MAQVEELITLLGVKLQPQALQNLDRFAQGIKGVVATTITLASVNHLWNSFRGITDATAQMQIFSDTTGVSTERLQEWQYAAESMGLSANAVQSDLAKLQKQTAWSGRNLESYADMFKGMSAPVANIWGDALGISPDTVRLLREGSEGIRKLKEEAHSVGAILSPEDIKRAYEFKRSLAGLTVQMRALGNSIALSFLPHAEKALAWFKDWIAENREAARNRIEKWTDEFSKAIERLNKLFDMLKGKAKSALGPLWDLGKVMLENVEWSEALAGALALVALALTPLLLPVLKAVAVITLLSVALEDLISFMNGDRTSMIGRFVDAFTEKFPELTRLFSSLAKGIVPAAIAVLKDFWDTLKNIAGGIGGVVDTIAEGVEAIAASLNRLTGNMTDEEKAAYDKKQLETGKRNAAWQLDAEGWSAGSIDRIKKNGGTKFAENMVKSAGSGVNLNGQKQPVDTRPGNSQSISNTTNNNNQTNNFHFNGYDPMAIMDNVRGFLSGPVNMTGIYVPTVQ